MPSPYPHIALFRLSAMGDVAMVVPVIRALVKQYPDLRITLVTRGFFAPFFAEFPQVQVLAVDLNQRHKGMLGLYRLFKDIRATGATSFVDLHQVLRSKVVGIYAQLNGVPVVRIDKGRAEKKALTRVENKAFKPLKPTTERYADALRKLGFPISLKDPAFPPVPVLSDSILQVMGKKKTKWVGIAPFAQHQAKVYPLDLMRKVIESLDAEGNIDIYVFGAGAKETAQIDELIKKLPHAHSMAGKIKFAEELQVIANLDVMLSMDSGNAHMAAMYNVPTVTLWGATHPYAGFAPYNQPEENALTADRNQYPLLPTSIYGNKQVEGYEDAMRSIDPTTVVDRIKAILKR